jgi:hypothetical protein
MSQLGCSHLHNWTYLRLHSVPHLRSVLLAALVALAAAQLFDIVQQAWQLL